MFLPRDMFYVAVSFYLLSGFLSIFLQGKRALLFRCIFGIGLFANFLSDAGRYYFSWPLMPMFQGPFFLPLFIGILSLKTIWQKRAGWNMLVALICLLSLAAAFFPNDFYLPFLKSKTIFSHLFLLSGIIGKSCFLIAGIHALDHIRQKGRSRKQAVLRNRSWAASWIVWGFGFWTFSMFSGEIWSYLSWGSPVVWDDAAITMTTATWFYYGCFLHLHLLKSWDVERRTYAAVFGAVLILTFNCCPELGGFRLPDTGILMKFL
ncbi:MAG: hypothetical protein C4B57_09095 [Deltaproteobacteria bacterium]|nr:MAG: hypothetical protein C4B57_09095 [Deltaproteobacteria bacterium]RKX58603.1 MAG: hypothetical protein DRP28_04595 [Thermodesulfobacteriota bacterium]RLB74818.1 MAG: hypothetical protein DRH15_15075 [Deltaproteobacteria bacterium]